jgi:hypothetical protein
MAMRLKDHTARSRHEHRHRARLRLKIGRRSALRADVAISSSGLLAIGGLVSSILLSTAVIVRAAKIDHSNPRPGDNDAERTVVGSVT